MTIFQKTLKEFIDGNKEKAYEIYLDDNDRINAYENEISFSRFCEEFKKIVKRHLENCESERIHSLLNY